MKVDVQGKRILIVGLARSGAAAAKVLSDLGAFVTVYDAKTRDQLSSLADEIEKYAVLTLGERRPQAKPYDRVIVSPGVPLDIPYIQDLKAIGCPVIGEIELAYRLTDGHFVGITGTNGKTTTTALVGAMFDADKRPHRVVGNIGVPAVSEACRASDEMTFVTELSSFQLESIVDFKADVAAILNITPDHLNRHKTMENYIGAKARIFENQNEEDALILNWDDPVTRELADSAKSRVFFFSRKEPVSQGAFLNKNCLVTRIDGQETDYCAIDDMKIFGSHNVENALAAILVARLSGVHVDAIVRALKTFPGVEHRIEFVGEVKGVRFYNDSKATNPDAALKAIEAMKAVTHLIAGGMDKGNRFDDLFDAFGDKIKTVTVFGETRDLWMQTATEKGYTQIKRVDTLDQAVENAFKNALPGEAVLLSPACASWDMYESYEHRGDHFKSIVNEMGHWEEK
ncbi:MAG: UDP-N-acetylmuramoylalanine--D-glutamate ligase [Clostridiales bacterium]|nr:UDP-N-acetylmuramoylalanine--D-glutamate ligase [Clostridiales bacterium]